jgi:hypothetical protein
LSSTDYPENKRKERRRNFISRTSAYWKEGKMLLHKNGIIITDEDIHIVYLNHRLEGRKVITTSLDGAYKYLMNVETEIKEELK